jgi:hypothetical protein
VEIPGNSSDPIRLFGQADSIGGHPTTSDLMDPRVLGEFRDGQTVGGDRRAGGFSSLVAPFWMD